MSANNLSISDFVMHNTKEPKTSWTDIFASSSHRSSTFARHDTNAAMNFSVTLLVGHLHCGSFAFDILTLPYIKDPISRQATRSLLRHVTHDVWRKSAILSRSVIMGLLCVTTTNEQPMHSQTTRPRSRWQNITSQVMSFRRLHYTLVWSEPGTSEAVAITNRGPL